MGIEKTIFGQNAFSKSCFPWSMLPEKPRHTSGFHKKVFMKRPVDTHLACLNIVLLQNSFKYDSVLSRNVKIRYFLSRNVKIRAMSRRNGINYATS